MSHKRLSISINHSRRPSRQHNNPNLFSFVCRIGAIEAYLDSSQIIIVRYCSVWGSLWKAPLDCVLLPYNTPYLFPIRLNYVDEEATNWKCGNHTAGRKNMPPSPRCGKYESGPEIGFKYGHMKYSLAKKSVKKSGLTSYNVIIAYSDTSVLRVSFEGRGSRLVALGGLIGWDLR